MSLTETTKIDKIEIVDGGFILVREATTILRNDVEVSTTYHRTSYSPGADTSKMPDKVQAIAAVTWTDEVIAAYQAQIAAQQRT
jgi:hypothetical protein